MSSNQALSFMVIGGRMTKWKGRAASIAPGLIAAAAVAVSSGLALADTVTGTQVTPFERNTDVDHGIDTGASVSVPAVPNTAVAVVHIDTAYSSTFTHNGAIIGSNTGTSNDFAGLRFNGDFSGTLTGPGSIALSQTNGNGVDLLGLEIRGSVLGGGVVDTSGPISVGLTGGASNYGTGIDVTGAIDGSLTNSGAVSVSISGGNGHATARGMYLRNIGGTFKNSGSVTVETSSLTSNADSMGIEAGTISGTFTNSGDVTVRGTGAGVTVADVYAIDVASVSGSFTNSGNIVAEAQGTRNASAFGIEAGTSTGMISSTGNMSLSADGGYSKAVGFSLNSPRGGFENTGDLNLNLMATSYGTAQGIFINSLQSMATNSGAISIMAQSSGSSVFATGIRVNTDNSSGVLKNSGAVTINVMGSLSATGYGLQLGAVSGSVMNSGAISVDAQADSSARGIGIATADVSGTLTNTGAVSVNVASNGTSAQGTGISTGAVSGSFNNSGALTVDVMSTSYATARGLNIGNVHGAVTNSGAIAVSAQGNGSSVQATSINVGGDNAAGVLTNSGALTVNVMGGSTATGMGIAAGGNNLGSFNNSGDIAINVTGYTYSANGTGILFGNVDAMRSFTNSGNVSVNLASANGANGSSSYAGGILTGNVLGTFNNSGNIALMMQNNGSMSSQTATGLRVNRVQAGGSFANSGDILIDSYNGGDVSLYGLATGSTLDGTFNNSGNVSINIQEFREYAYATGMDFSTVGTTGSLTNSGEVSINIATSQPAPPATGPFGPTFSMSAYGITISNTSGMVNNSGDILITLTDNSSVEYLYGTGLVTGQIQSTGHVVNSGNVTMVLNGGNSATFYGLYSSRIADGAVFENSGNLNLSITGARTYAYGTGIDLNDIGIGGRMTNSGDMVLRMSGGFSSATGYGIGSSRIHGTLENSGDMAISIMGTSNMSSGSIIGIYTGDVFSTGSLVNSGNLQLSIDGLNATSGAATIAGISSRAVHGSVLNSGNIQINLSGGSDLAAQGLRAFTVESGGSYSNSGQIALNVRADNAASGYVYATGFGVGQVNGGMMNNTGAISVMGEGVGTAYLSGIFAISATSGSVINSDAPITVMATGSAASSGSVRGIDIATMDGTLNVNGDISASGGGLYTHAVYLGAGSGTLNMNALVDAGIYVADHDVNLTHSGRSGVYAFEDAAVGSGAFTLLGADGVNTAWVSQDDGTAAPTYIAVAGSDFATETQGAFQMSGMTELLDGLLDQVSVASQDALNFGSKGEGATTYRFARGGAMFDDDGTTQTALGHLSAGFAAAPDAGRKYGVAAHGISQRQNTTGQSVRTEGLMVTGLAEYTFGLTTVNFGGGIGAFSNASTREVVGATDAIGDYGSTFFFATAGLKRHFDLGDQIGLNLYGEATVGHQQNEGYAETGSTAAATVSSRGIDFLEIRLGGTVDVAAMGGTVSLGLGAIHRDVSAPTSLGITVAGTPLTLATAGSGSETLGEVSLGYSWYGGKGGHIHLSASAEFGGTQNNRSIGMLFEQRF